MGSGFQPQDCYSLEGFAREQDASCTDDWSYELFQCCIDYYEIFAMQSYYYLFIYSQCVKNLPGRKRHSPCPKGSLLEALIFGCL